MSRQADDLEIGHAGKAHGLRGEIKVRLTTDRLERLAPGSTLKTDNAELTVAASRPHQNVHIVRFTEVTTRNDAEALQGATLFAAPLEDPDALWVHELIGLQVVDQHGTPHGQVDAVQANPAADLLVTAHGALVPLTFYTRHDATQVHVEVPDGLFELGQED